MPKNECAGGETAMKNLKVTSLRTKQLKNSSRNMPRRTAVCRDEYVLGGLYISIRSRVYGRAAGTESPH
jgi:hypothetical protein